MKNTLPLEIFAIYFSAYSAHAIEYNGTIYPTLEHAYHCLRYTDHNIINEIIAARSPMLAWAVSQKYKKFQIEGFGDKKVEVMKMLMELKAEQHDDVKQALIDSKDLVIIKHITTGPAADGFWDDGEDGKGQNLVGKMWMEIRSKILN